MKTTVHVICAIRESIRSESMINSLNISNVVSNAISFAALAVSILALRRTKDTKAQYEANITTSELNKRELARLEADKPAKIKITYDADEQILHLKNMGNSDAVSVIAELKDKPEMVDLEDRFPLEIDSGEVVDVPMQAWIGHPDFVNIKVSWKDKEGNSYDKVDKLYL